MTAYGQSSFVCPLGRFFIEIQCVNRKYLDIQTTLPSEFFRFDGEIKKKVAESIKRGQVNIRVQVVFDAEAPLQITPNLAVARQLKSAWEQVASELGTPLDPQILFTLLSSQKVLVYHENFKSEKQFLDPLLSTLDQALIQVNAMRANEGQVLHQEIVSRFHKLSLWMEEIELKAPHTVEKYREKLLDKMHEMMQPSAELEERLFREVCLFADKIDIAEEITRFKSHLTQVNGFILQKASDGHGKSLEFLVQELNREINTINAKSNDIEISRIALAIKTELERIREQIQNIE